MLKVKLTIQVVLLFFATNLYSAASLAFHGGIQIRDSEESLH